MGMFERKPDFEFHIVQDRVTENCHIEERQGMFGQWQPIKISGQHRILTFPSVEEAKHWIEHEVAERVKTVIIVQHLN
jgi:hypothetical protein